MKKYDEVLSTTYNSKIYVNAEARVVHAMLPGENGTAFGGTDNGAYHINVICE